jgi:hypothetical protein
MTRRRLSSVLRLAEVLGMSKETPFHGAVTPFQVLVNHFESNNFRFHADPESQVVHFFITGDCAVYNCRLQLTHDGELIQVRVHYPISARDLKIRPLVAEALARANHGMSIGGFDIDMDSGEISFHLGQVIRGHELDDDTVDGVFSSALSTADRYFSAVVRVMFAGHTPADAVYLSELDVHSEAIGTEETPVAPAPRPLKPLPKKRRSPRRDPRAKTTRDLPGLFDDPPR